MSEWIYSGNRNHKMKKPLKKFIDFIEKELIQLLFFETSLVFDYEIIIQQFDEGDFNKECFLVQIVCFIENNYNRKFVLMTFYFDSIFLYPIKIQGNYIDENISVIENELSLKKFLEDKMGTSFFELVRNIEKNVKLITLNSNEIEESFFNRSYNDKQYVPFEIHTERIHNVRIEDSLPFELNTNYNNRSKEKNNNKRWTKKEKKIIIDNILNYREEILNEDRKEVVRRKTILFAKKLLNLDIDGIFEERSIKALSNRIAYFEDLLAGVNKNYSQVDKIYFGKLRRINGDITENKARMW